jgi:hypothetical protein
MQTLEKITKKTCCETIKVNRAPYAQPIMPNCPCCEYESKDQCENYKSYAEWLHENHEEPIRRGQGAVIYG